MSQFPQLVNSGSMLEEERESFLSCQLSFCEWLCLETTLAGDAGKGLLAEVPQQVVACGDLHAVV